PVSCSLFPPSRAIVLRPSRCGAAVPIGVLGRFRMRAEVPGSLMGSLVGTPNGPRPTLSGCPSTEPPRKLRTIKTKKRYNYPRCPAVAFVPTSAGIHPTQLGEYSYADASLYGGDHDVHHGHGPKFSGRTAHQSRPDGPSS